VVFSRPRSRITVRASVIGGSTLPDPIYEQAREVGRLLGSRGHEPVCGGRGEVCRGTQEASCHTIGILPGSDRESANQYVDPPIATGTGNAGNALVALNGDALRTGAGA
jgi:uncharacterized protein (TIGR00725 family)